MSQLAVQFRTRLRSDAGRAVAASFSAAVVARLILLTLAVLLARQLGPEGYGTFTFAIGVAMVGGQMSGLGWPTLMNRLIPGFVKDQDWPHLKGLRNAGDAVVLLTSVTIAATLFLVSDLTGDLSRGFKMAALLLPPLALAILRRQQLAAVRHAAIGIVFDQSFGALALVLAILVVGAMSLEQSVLIYASALAVGVLITSYLFRRRLPRELGGAPAGYQVAAWATLALPMVIGTASKQLMTRIDILMLAPLSTLHEVGLYGAAFRVTYLLTFPQVALMTVLTPMFSHAFTHGHTNAVRRQLKGALLFAAVTTVPAALVLFTIPDFIMNGVFGPKFGAGAPTLAILAISQTAASITIPFSSMLLMGGRERIFGTVNIAALGLNMLLCFILIPRFGAVGAASATLVSATALLLAQIVLSRPLLARPQPSV